MLVDWLSDIFFTISRWLHIVCTTLVVGGTLFFEFVVPIAIEDLKKEQQLTVFGNARWVFRRVIVVCSVILLLSGAVTIYRLWDMYYNLPGYEKSLAWSMAHVGLGIVGLGIALLLTIRGRPPEHPIGWMRINLGLLLIGIFAAVAARHVRMGAREEEATFGREMREAQMRQPATRGVEGR
jgi:multisubunit Na+/H+ antiporter MnhG subunit